MSANKRTDKTTRRRGDASLTNAHAISKSDTPMAAPHLVSIAALNVQPASTATKTFLLLSGFFMC